MLYNGHFSKSPMSPDLASLVSSSLQAHHGAKSQNGYLQSIVCLKCGNPKAFTKLTDPRSIRCNSESCDGHAGMPWSDYATEVYNDYKASFKHDDGDMSRLQSYALQRGIPNFLKWGGIYATVQIGEGTYKALGFKTSTGSMNYRLPEPPFPDAAHWNDKGSDMKRSYWVPSVEFKKDERVYIAEAPIKAMALLESGRQAISVLSAGARPGQMPELVELLNGFESDIVLAFDNDERGREATKKWYYYLLGMKKKPVVCLPIGGDWDSLLVAEKLTDDFMNRCEALTGADYASDAWNAIARYHDLTEEYPTVMEYRGAWYKPVVRSDKNGETKLCGVECILDGILKPAYQLICQPLDSERVKRDYFFFAMYKEHEKSIKRLVSFDAREVSIDRDFSIALANQTSLSFDGTKKDLTYIKREVLKFRDMAHVRAMERYGYDETTGSFIFSHVAFTKDGRVLSLNSDEFFSDINVRPTAMESAISKIAHSGDVGQFYNLLYQAAGPQGLIVAAYYVATIASAVNFSIPVYCGNHPFLSVCGKPGTGKSTLITLLNAAFSFQAGYEGVIQGASTTKGILRTMAKAVCVPIVLAESNKEIEAEGQSRRYSTLDENTLLGLYNRQSGQTRANKEGSGTNRMPFDAGLVFSQNYEPFKLQSVKERVISVKIDSTVFTPEQKEAIAALQELTKTKQGVVPITGVGSEHYRRYVSLAKRQADLMEKSAGWLRKIGIENDRNTYHHGNLIAMLTAIHGEFGLDRAPFDEACALLVKMAREKPAQSQGESDLSASFFEAFEALCFKGHESGAFLERGEHYVVSGDKVYLRMTEVLNVMARTGYDVARSPYLKSALRQCGRFVGDRFNLRGAWTGCHEIQKTWVFKVADMNLPGQ